MSKLTLMSIKQLVTNDFGVKCLIIWKITVLLLPLFLLLLGVKKNVCYNKTRSKFVSSICKKKVVDEQRVKV